MSRRRKTMTRQPPPSPPRRNCRKTSKLRTGRLSSSRYVISLLAPLYPNLIPLANARSNPSQQDKYLRSVADFRNLQERTRREVQAARDFALQKFARDLLDSVDNLDRALATVPTDSLSGDSPNADLVALHGGLRMTEDILMGTLKKHGLERFDPAAETARFDPNVHEAVFQTPQQGKEDGTVFHTQQKGFMLNGRVLRAAKVGVVKNS